jgi:uncharacterized Zn ribbon protein
MMGAIAGVLSSRSNAAPAYIYFTSALYPFAVRDEIAAGTTALTTGRLWGLATENIGASATLQSGTLVATIAYVPYTMQIENIDASVTLQSGTLVTTINYVYSTFNIENITASATLQSGTLVTTINYVESTFNIENITASASLQSGTLI